MNKQNINEAIEKFGKDAIEAVDPTYAQAVINRTVTEKNLEDSMMNDEEPQTYYNYTYANENGFGHEIIVKASSKKNANDFVKRSFAGQTYKLIKTSKADGSHEFRADDSMLNDFYNKFEKETDVEFLEQSVSEMRRYERNWNYEGKKNAGCTLPELRRSIKFAEKRLQELRSKNESMTHESKKLFLGESLDTETKQYKRYTFNIQVLPTDDLNVDYLSMTDVPENVLEKLGDEIKNYAVNQVVIYNDEFEDQSEEITEHLGDDPVLKVEDVRDFEPWNQAVSVYELIFNAGKLDQLQGIIEDLYQEGITEEELNDLLWTEDEWLLNELKIGVENDD